MQLHEGYSTEGGPISSSGTVATGAVQGSGAGGKFAGSPTGRSSNALYDVVRFGFVVYLNAHRMLEFNNELSHNRFINVLQMDVVAVDRAADQAAGYWYGDAPVVKVTYDCEALFLRDWTKKWMPKEVKDRLGITDDKTTSADIR